VCDEDGLFCFDYDYAFFALLWYIVSFELEMDGGSCVGFAWLRICFCVFVCVYMGVCMYVDCYVTFFPYRLRSSAFRVMYFAPAMWKPVLMTFFGSEESVNAPTTTFTSAGEIVKCGEAAQTLVPSAPNIAALSV